MQQFLNDLDRLVARQLETLVAELRQQQAANDPALVAHTQRLHTEATWRLNEAEAVTHASFLEEYSQYLLVNYGERRNGSTEEAEGHPEGVHAGDPTRYQGFYTGIKYNQQPNQ